MSTTVPTLTTAQLDGLACVRCGADDTEQQPTGDRGPDGAQLFACTDPDVCRAQQSIDTHFPLLAALRTKAQSAPVFVEHHLADGVPLLYGHKDGTLTVTYDPAQLTFESARELFAEAHALYPDARAVAFTNIGHIVTTSLPTDEPPARFESHGARCTVTFDDTRITKKQLLALMDKVVGL
ncbi:hypothetical protein OG912_24885 [Streptomyces sp. NBC_00464]|uniref:hypothetical protein n=1 Tax=Streptomyces sp. NBC_00464 TaxID=2975751 RepID=UPI002E16DC40